jgi:threonine dehydratase
MSAIRLPTIADVRAARQRLGTLALRTPLLTHPALDAATGGRILLKAESLQRVGAFKFRGAYNKIVQVDRAAYPGGVVACSSGNHAQGVAAAATIAGLPSLIVMPSDAPALKIARTKAFGAQVHLYDRVNEDRDAIALRLAGERRAAMVHPFDDPDVMSGQGTAGLELMEQAAVLGRLPDAVLVPCSGGGLASGVALAVKASAPTCEVWAVEPAGFDDLARSLESGQREKNARLSGSICDALLSPSPGAITFEVLRRNLAGSVTATDAEVRTAIRFAYHELKLVLEPGGAIALAALLHGRIAPAGRTIAVVLSGGNIDPSLFAEIIGEAGAPSLTPAVTGR